MEVGNEPSDRAAARILGEMEQRSLGWRRTTPPRRNDPQSETAAPQLRRDEGDARSRHRRRGLDQGDRADNAGRLRGVGLSPAAKASKTIQVVFRHPFAVKRRSKTARTCTVKVGELSSASPLPLHSQR